MADEIWEIKVLGLDERGEDVPFGKICYDGSSVFTDPPDDPVLRGIVRLYKAYDSKTDSIVTLQEDPKAWMRAISAHGSPYCRITSPRCIRKRPLEAPNGRLGPEGLAEQNIGRHFPLGGERRNGTKALPEDAPDAIPEPEPTSVPETESKKKRAPRTKNTVTPPKVPKSKRQKTPMPVLLAETEAPVASVPEQSPVPTPPDVDMMGRPLAPASRRLGGPGETKKPVQPPIVPRESPRPDPAVSGWQEERRRAKVESQVQQEERAYASRVEEEKRQRESAAQGRNQPFNFHTGTPQEAESQIDFLYRTLNQFDEELRFGEVDVPFMYRDLMPESGQLDARSAREIRYQMIEDILRAEEEFQQYSQLNRDRSGWREHIPPYTPGWDDRWRENEMRSRVIDWTGEDPLRPDLGSSMRLGDPAQRTYQPHQLEALAREHGRLFQHRIMLGDEFANDEEGYNLAHQLWQRLWRELPVGMQNDPAAMERARIIESYERPIQAMRQGRLPRRAIPEVTLMLQNEGFDVTEEQVAAVNEQNSGFTLANANPVYVGSVVLPTGQVSRAMAYEHDRRYFGMVDNYPESNREFAMPEEALEYAKEIAYYGPPEQQQERE